MRCHADPQQLKEFPENEVTFPSSSGLLPDIVTDSSETGVLELFSGADEDPIWSSSDSDAVAHLMELEQVT